MTDYNLLFIDIGANNPNTMRVQTGIEILLSPIQTPTQHTLTVRDNRSGPVARKFEVRVDKYMDHTVAIRQN